MPDPAAPGRPEHRSRPERDEWPEHGGWPSIGVVVPTRGTCQRLRATLESIDAQHYPGRLRVIVVADQSPPDLSLARSGDRPLLVLTNWRTPGRAGARNAGVLALDTDLVAFATEGDLWLPGKLVAQVAAIGTAEVCTTAVEQAQAGRRPGGADQPGQPGVDRIELADLLARPGGGRRTGGLLVRRAALLGEVGLLAEDAPGHRYEGWDLLLRAAKRAPVAHVDRPLVRVARATGTSRRRGYPERIAALRWLMARHPEIATSPPGAAGMYGRLACWTAATGNNREAWRYTRAAVRRNWHEPRVAIALAAVAGVVRLESVLDLLDRRGHHL